MIAFFLLSKRDYFETSIARLTRHTIPKPTIFIYICDSRTNSHSVVVVVVVDNVVGAHYNGATHLPCT